MIIGIGCDIVEHELTSALKWETRPNALSRIFSSKELELIRSPLTVKYISGRFAAKEAVLKSLNSVMEDGISLTDIEIFQAVNGKPEVVLSGDIKSIADSINLSLILVSIAHSDKYSIAYAVAEAKDL